MASKGELRKKIRQELGSYPVEKEFSREDLIEILERLRSGLIF